MAGSRATAVLRDAADGMAVSCRSARILTRGPRDLARACFEVARAGCLCLEIRYSRLKDGSVQETSLKAEGSSHFGNLRPPLPVLPADFPVLPFSLLVLYEGSTGKSVF